LRLAPELSLDVTAFSQSTLGGDEQASSVLRRFITDPQSVTIEEQYQAVMNLHAIMLILQSSFYLEEEGTLTPQIRRSITNALTSELGVRYYWEQRKTIFVNEDFIAFIEQLFSDGYTHSQDFYRPQDEQ
jgi:hypothetical protein